MGDTALRYSIEDDAMEDGLRWRATARDSYGHLDDATRWTTSPARATRDLQRLQLGTYWTRDNAAPYRGYVRAA